MISRFGRIGAKHRAIAPLIAITALAAAAAAYYFLATWPTIKFAVPVNARLGAPEGQWPISEGWPRIVSLPISWELGKKSGVHIEEVQRVAGKGAVAAMLDGNSDIAWTAAPPIVDAISKGKAIRILAMTEEAEEQVQLITRAEHKEDWFKQPILTFPGTILEIALVAELKVRGLDHLYATGQLELPIALTPLSSVTSLLDGTVPTATVLRPYGDLLLKASANSKQFVNITTTGAYTFHGFIVTTESNWHSKREGILRTLEAIAILRDTVSSDPKRALATIHKYEAGHSPIKHLPTSWESTDFIFTTDADRIKKALSHNSALLIIARRGKLPPLEFGATLSALPDVRKRIADRPARQH